MTGGLLGLCTEKAKAPSAAKMFVFKRRLPSLNCTQIGAVSELHCSPRLPETLPTLQNQHSAKALEGHSFLSTWPTGDLQAVLRAWLTWFLQAPIFSFYRRKGLSYFLLIYGDTQLISSVLCLKRKCISSSGKDPL